MPCPRVGEGIEGESPMAGSACFFKLSVSCRYGHTLVPSGSEILGYSSFFVKSLGFYLLLNRCCRIFVPKIMNNYSPRHHG